MHLLQWSLLLCASLACCLGAIVDDCGADCKELERLVQGLKDECATFPSRERSVPGYPALLRSDTYDFSQYPSDERSVLNRLFWYHGSDRGHFGHEYGDFYDSVFTSTFGRHRCEVSRVLEIGLGSVDTAIPSSMAGWQILHKDYRPGGSLRVWHDFFPNAYIVGFDIDPMAVGEINSRNDSARIEAFMVNSFNRTGVVDAIQSIRQSAKYHAFLQENLVVGRVDDGDDNQFAFDVIIDDGLHHNLAMKATLSFLWPFLRQEFGTYVIEDVESIGLYDELQSFFVHRDNDHQRAVLSVQADREARSRLVAVNATDLARQWYESERENLTKRLNAQGVKTRVPMLLGVTNSRDSSCIIALSRTKKNPFTESDLIRGLLLVPFLWPHDPLVWNEDRQRWDPPPGGAPRYLQPGLAQLLKVSNYGCFIHPAIPRNTSNFETCCVSNVAQKCRIAGSHDLSTSHVDKKERFWLDKHLTEDYHSTCCLPKVVAHSVSGIIHQMRSYVISKSG